MDIILCVVFEYKSVRTTIYNVLFCSSFIAQGICVVYDVIVHKQVEPLQLKENTVSNYNTSFNFNGQ